MNNGSGGCVPAVCIHCTNVNVSLVDCRGDRSNQTGSGVQMTSAVTGGAISSSLSALEPMVYFATYQVYSNVECGASDDYNRMSAKSSLSQAEGNKGWGLGTLYDATYGSTTLCGPSGSASARPQCDAQVRTRVGARALLCSPRFAGQVVMRLWLQFSCYCLLRLLLARCARTAMQSALGCGVSSCLSACACV
jgi:hypothetical protein